MHWSSSLDRVPEGGVLTVPVVLAVQAQSGNPGVDVVARPHSATRRRDGSTRRVIHESELGVDRRLDPLLDKARTTTPTGRHGTFSEQTYLDIVAHLFRANQLPAGNDELKNGSTALRRSVNGDHPPE